MKIALSGAGGFIGKHLASYITGRGHKIIIIRRSDLLLEEMKIAKIMEGAHVIINLAGSPVLKRWSKKNRKLIYNSRVLTTRKLVDAVRLMNEKPGTFISASAVGIYNNTDIHDEFSRLYSEDFLRDVISDWELEVTRSAEHGIRTVIFRLGVVLGKDGGAFPRMLFPYRLFLGGPIGTGKQYIPFVHIEDVVRAFWHAVENPGFKGIYNLVAPQMITSKSLAKLIGKYTSRPSIFRVPSIALRFLFGRGASILTNGQKVIPGRLTEEGFVFRFPNVDQCLKDLLSA